MKAFSVTEILKKYQQEFHPVISFNAATDKFLSLDFTAANTALTQGILDKTDQFSEYINQQLLNAGALYGIGGYDEHRTVYSISKVFDAANTNEEPRRLHLGTDIWGKAHTKIMAPLDGIVHSFAFNDQFGDYGATIILAHNLEGINFYTLYGHLSLNSIKNIDEGSKIAKGTSFAALGLPAENGHWPPHLHLQIIIDIQNWKGDYPGVCSYSQKEKWLANSPNPEFILNLSQHTI